MSTYGIPDDELAMQRAEAEEGEAFSAIPTPLTDSVAYDPRKGSLMDFARYLERRLAVATKERDAYKSALVSVQKCLKTPNQAIVDTIWIGPGETLLDCVEYALGNDQ